MNENSNHPSDTPAEFSRGKKVILRPLLRADLPKLIRWINDPDIRQYVLAFWPAMEKNEEEWLDRLAGSKSDAVFIIAQLDGTAIGVIGLHKICWHDRTATTGSFIGEKQYWSKGYGSEAKMLLLHYAFHTLNLRKICSSVIAYNKRSYGCLRKCGYVDEGRKKQQHFKRGRYWDEIFLAVFRKDWEPLWRKFQKGGWGK